MVFLDYNVSCFNFKWSRLFWSFYKCIESRFKRGWQSSSIIIYSLSLDYSGICPRRPQHIYSYSRNDYKKVTNNPLFGCISSIWTFLNANDIHSRLYYNNLFSYVVWIQPFCGGKNVVCCQCTIGWNLTFVSIYLEKGSCAKNKLVEWKREAF